MSITVTPMSAACGAEISGIDLREPIDAAAVKEIEDAFHEHVVVVFRGQDITEDEQMAFANAFGGLGDRKRSPNGSTPGFSSCWRAPHIRARPRMSFFRCSRRSESTDMRSESTSFWPSRPNAPIPVGATGRS